MKSKCFTVFSVIILGIVISLNVNAQSSVNDKAGAKAFVKQFYNWYVVLYNKPVDKDHPITEAIALKQKSIYFDAPLRAAILDDITAQAKAKGELVGLEFDCFLAAQDDGFGYEPGDVKQVGNKLQVDIHSAGIHKPKKDILAGKVAVIAEVVKTGTGWKFTNFIYPADGKGKQTDLLQTLADLHKEREQSKGK